MDVILHIGAHRTATTSFQAYLRSLRGPLEARGIAVWDPRRTRKGVLTGVMPSGDSLRSPEKQFARARGVIALNMDQLRQGGARALLVSDENILGNPRANLRAGALYPDGAARIARHLEAFGGSVTMVCLSLRSLESYWTSCLHFALARGHDLPDPRALDQLAMQPRGWRQLIEEIAQAVPGVPLLLLDHAEYAARPEARLQAMLNLGPMPAPHVPAWLNASLPATELQQMLSARGQALPLQGASWHPFGPAARAALAERDAADAAWIAAGAGGLAATPGPITVNTEQARPRRRAT